MAQSFLWKESAASRDIRTDHPEASEIIVTNDTRLENFIMQNSPVNNEIARNTYLNDLLTTDVDGQLKIVPTSVVSRNEHGKTSQVITMCAFSYGEDTDADILEIKGANKITPYDRRVYNALSTLYMNGRTTISLTEIYAVMTGYKRTNPNTSQIKRIEDAIRKFCSINAYIDMTDEVNARILDKQPLIDAGFLKDKSDKVKKATIESKLLHVRVGTLESESGKVYKSYKLLDEPTLLTYNRAKRTLISIPMEYVGLLNTSATDKTIAFQDYLLMRLMSYKNKKMKENRILYSTLYRDSGVPNPADMIDDCEDKKKAKEMAKTTIKRDREIIVKMMVEWKNSGLISSFKEYKEGQSIVGIQFEMDEAPKLENREA